VDPLDLLADLGITVAWVATMAHAAIYLPKHRIVVLNADCGRDELAEALSEALPEYQSR
jgi:hypothetical protein